MRRVPEPLVLGLPLLAALFVMGLTLGHGFAFDDPMAVITNPLLDESRSWLDAFTHDFWGERSGYEHIASWRPLTLWSLRWLGGAQPMAFHLTNGLLHLMIVLLALQGARRLGASSWGSLWLGLFVALTPAFSEATASIVGRGDLLAAFFGLCGMYWIRERPAWALVSLSLALLSKETAIVYALSAGAWALLGRMWLRCGLLALLAFVWYGLRSSVVGHLGGAIPPLDNPLVAMSFDERIIAGLGLVGRYVSWILAAQPVPADMAAGVEHGGLYALTGALALFALGGLLVDAWRKGHALVLGASLALVSLVLLSNIALLLPTPAAGRLAYHPGLGLSLICALMLSKIPSTHALWRSTHLVAFGLLLIGAFSGVQTLKAWESDLTLFEANVEIEPQSARGQTNLAKLLIERGDLERAHTHLKQALDAAPAYPLALLNLSALLERQQPGGEQAWALAQEAVAKGSGLKKAHANLCALAVLRPQLEARRVLAYCQDARHLMPSSPEVHVNLARAYERIEGRADAERVFAEALAMHPEHPFVVGHWVGYLVRKGSLEEALRAQRGLAMSRRAPPSARPNLVALLFQLAKKRQVEERHPEACELVREAKALAPGVHAVAERAKAFCLSP